ncbi:MAG: hypothetical protein IIA45_06710 [Bacteroidetes bacterium]|nr:hypothetical protein [Bacteroidota bacterium]
MVIKNFISSNLILVILFFTFTNAFAQWGSDWAIYSSNYIFNHGSYFANHKLGSNNVTAFAVDNDGNKWFGIAGVGLKVYDGKKLKYFKPSKSTFSKKIRAIACDKDNNIWVGTNLGIRIFDGDNWSSVQVPNIRNIKEIVIADDGKIWVSGWTSDAINALAGGISMFDGKDWVNYNRKNSGLVKNYVEDIVIDKEGHVWMAVGLQDYGVCEFDGKEWNWYNRENSELPSDIVRAIAVDGDNNKWFGTPNGLAKFDGENWEVTTLKDLFAVRGFEFLALEPDLLSLAVEENGVMWIGTKGAGIIRIENNGKVVLNKENCPITSDYVKKIYIDKENRKYFITGFRAENVTDVLLGDDVSGFEKFGGVVMYLDPNFNLYPEWTIYNSYTTENKSDLFYSLAEDSRGNIWLTSSGDGLAKYSEDKWSFYNSTKTGILGDMLYSLAISEDDDIWAGSRTKGVKKLEGDVLRSYTKSNSDLPVNAIQGMICDKNGKVWMGSHTGVITFDGKKWEQHTKKSVGLPGNFVYNCFEDSKGNIWIGTNKGVVKYDGKTWTVFNKKMKNLPNNNVIDMVEDSKGHIWFGTQGGLAIYDGNSWEIIKKLNDQVSYFMVNALAVDQDDNVWIGTDKKGLIRADGVGYMVFNPSNSGILYKKVNDILITKDNELWVSLSKGPKPKDPSAYMPPKPDAPVDPGIAIREKIEEFDLKSAVVKHKL